MYICAGLLPLSYIVGLLFTLKTHSYIFKNLEESEGHVGPNWSKTFSTFVLGASIALFALISEKAIEVKREYQPICIALTSFYFCHFLGFGTYN